MPKFKRRYTKYKIYKQLRSDITGEILLKYKINKITVFILKNFEYKLNKFKNDFKKWASIFSFRNKHVSNWGHSAFESLNKPNHYLDTLSVRKVYNMEILVLFLNANLLRKKLMKVWRIKQRQKFIIKNHFKTTNTILEKEYSNDLHENYNEKMAPFDPNWNPFEDKKIESNHTEHLDSENVMSKNIADSVITQEDISQTKEENEQQDHVEVRKKKIRSVRANTNFRGLVLNKSNQKFIKLNWLNIQLNEKKYAHFYGFKSIPRFKLLQDSAFYCNKLRANGIFKLEGMISVVALRLNMAPTVYQCRSIVQSGVLLVNGLRVLNPTFRVKLLEDISVNGPDEYEFMMDVMHSRLYDRKFFVNVPDYIEINYKIFHACFWRYPHKSEIFGPYNYPFGKSPHDWSSSTKKIRR